LAALRKERQRLQELRKRESWDDIETKLRADQEAVEHLQQEITVLAGQEGLPIPIFEDGANQTPPEGAVHRTPAELKAFVEETIKGTEREIASLDGKLDLESDLVTQIKVYQDALDVLLTRRQTVLERRE